MLFWFLLPQWSPAVLYRWVWPVFSESSDKVFWGWIDHIFRFKWIFSLNINHLGYFSVELLINLYWITCHMGIATRRDWEVTALYTFMMLWLLGCVVSCQCRPSTTPCIVINSRKVAELYFTSIRTSISEEGRNIQ